VDTFLSIFDPTTHTKRYREGLGRATSGGGMGYISPNVVMIYAPRNAGEIEIVAGLVAESYRYAGGRGS
jgi:hypothetical protein